MTDGRHAHAAAEGWVLDLFDVCRHARGGPPAARGDLHLLAHASCCQNLSCLM